MANMSMQFLCNMTFTPIIAGAAPAAAAPANNNMETATQRRRRQRAASVQRCFEAYEDRLNRRSYDRNDEPRGYNNRPYYNDRRNADYSYHGRGRGGRGGSRRRSQSRPNDRGRRQYFPARRNNRDPRPPQHGWGELATQTAGGQDAILNGGRLVPIVPEARRTVDVAAPIDVSQNVAAQAPPENLGVAPPVSVEVIDFVSPEAVAVAEPIETLEPIDAQAPLEVQEATGAQEPLEVPENDVAQAQFEALEAADAQATAEVPEVGAQAPLKVPEVVDVNAQEVADEQATANVDITAGDDDHAAAPLDAAGPTQ
ncbi:hypothetical protein AC1031_007282 [Aphanomyces cochlioides]|nr:hypothetical protein AC1031_007282 [Aphanomyces cochlioides]